MNGESGGKAVGQLLFDATLSSRSEAYRWLRANHGEIAAVFAKQARPPWEALRKTAVAAGLIVSTHALRRAWARLERDLAREAGRQVKPARSVPPPPITPPAAKDPTAHVSTDGTRGFSYSPLPDPDAEKWRPAKK